MRCQVTLVLWRCGVLNKSLKKLKQIAMMTFRDILQQKEKLDWTLEPAIDWTRLDVLILLVFWPLKTFLTSPEKVVRKIEIMPTLQDGQLGTNQVQSLESSLYFPAGRGLTEKFCSSIVSRDTTDEVWKNLISFLQWGMRPIFSCQMYPLPLCQRISRVDKGVSHSLVLFDS